MRLVPRQPPRGRERLPPCVLGLREEENTMKGENTMSHRDHTRAPRTYTSSCLSPRLNTRRTSRRSSSYCRTTAERSRIGLAFLPVSGVWFPAKKASDPVRALPLLVVAVARKPPAAQVKANHVRCRAGTAANSAVLAYRSLHFECSSLRRAGLPAPLIRLMLNSTATR
jgi:hypothetical protein